MKGYDTVKEFVEDYKVYVTVKTVDMRKSCSGYEGLTVTKVWKERIDTRLEKATKRFKKLMSKNGYTLDDLKLIAVNDSLKHVKDLRQVIMYAYGTSKLNPGLIKKFLKSRALQNGRLYNISRIIPTRIKTQRELRSFIVRYGSCLHHSEMKVLFDAIAPKEWSKWLEELIESGEVVSRWGRITT